MRNAKCGLRSGERFFSTLGSRALPRNGLVSDVEEAFARLEKKAHRICPEDYITVLDLCGNCEAIEQGRRVHGEITRQGLESNVLLGNRLVQMYLRCGQPGEAERVFYKMARKANPVHWTGMITTLVRGFFFSSAWSLFRNMLLAGVCVDRCTLVTVIDLCRSLQDSGASSLIRSIVEETGRGAETSTGTALIGLLQERVEDARRVFDGICERDVRAWNAIMEVHLRKMDYPEVIKLFNEMDVEPDKATFVNVVSACSGSGALEEGRAFHQLAIERGFEGDPQVDAAVFSFYSNSKTPDLVDRSSVILWTRRMAASTEAGNSDRTLQLLHLMQLEGIKPDRVCLLTALNATKDPSYLQQGKAIHSHAQELGLGLLTSLMNSVINMYSKCGSLEDGIKVFHRIEKDVVSWNTLLGAFVQSGLCSEALEHFHRMQLEGTLPDQVTLTIMLSVCTSRSWLRTGETIHSCLVERGEEASVAHAISSMYGRCGRRLHRVLVLDEGSTPDRNSKMAAYNQHGDHPGALELYKDMLLQGFTPDKVTFLTALAAAQETCAGDISPLESHAREAGYETDTVVATALLDSYSKRGCLEEAHRVFTGLSKRSLVSWTAMISAYAHHNLLRDALRLFRLMQLEGVAPNTVTLAAMSSARASPLELALLRDIYENFLPNECLGLATGNAVLSVYSKLGEVKLARKVFSRMCDRSVVTWNTMISGYAEAGECDESIQLFYRMQLESEAEPDKFTLIATLSACCGEQVMKPGRVVHQLAEETGTSSELLVGTALVHMYSQCGSLELAEQAFSGISNPDTISWNAFIAALSHHGEHQRALGCPELMNKARVGADGITFVALLNACTAISELHLGERLLAEAIRCGFRGEVRNAAINFLGKCGCLEAASSLFDKDDQSLLTWNGLITAYAQSGCSDEALELLRGVFLAGVQPDSVSFVSVLSTLSHSGLLELACREFSRMKLDYGIQPSASHLGCIVDVLGRVGWLDDAEQLLASNSDNVLWTNLLAACRIHGDNPRGKRVIQELFELQPRDPANYVVLSHIASGSSQ